ncbi:Ni/Fe-hydrogenase, b-type cytochrome subunit [Thermosinus carboxydivorans Nor1]|uniref:Ni/Fe-hydrogenase, b-type cytochrome subunit n=1 Tax=Thermosinus carboxydivorans Nor1 TaxID=401526 RepID=A1HTR5_9FIRM|nr:Ni/Fe-hydrogenase, b-type cytochrome subunit [Thermosinus carboxydivorans]EAX46615.1 Ni/Fe-hydrogenase, b-type cytochrome subunit [Thermosinus carboxydivorans Nor1]
MKNPVKSVDAYYVFSGALRLFHWVMVPAIVVLFLTGLYIGNPFFIGTQGIEATFAVTNILSMESMRYNHFVTAYLLTSSLILRVYGWIINKGDRLLPRFWTRHFWGSFVDTTLHYLFLRPQHRPYLRNSLARTAYLAVYIMILLEIITGFAMYSMIDPNSWAAKVFGPVNFLFVNEYVVHLIHHYTAWLIVLFVIVHLYMASRADWMEKGGEISGIISGVKFYEEKPEDLSDIQ